MTDRLTSSDLVLVRQKDSLLNSINQAEVLLHCTDKSSLFTSGVIAIDSAMSQLELVRELWLNEDYGYKVAELSQRMLLVIEEVAEHCPESHQAKHIELTRLAIRARQLKPVLFS